MTRLENARSAAAPRTQYKHRAIFALALAAMLASAALPARAAADASLVEQPSFEEQAQVARVNAYFNRFVYLSGRFTQISPDGVVSEGMFHMRRPGRVRFDYLPPSRLLVISDGFWLGIIDKKLKTTDRYPIASTPY
ncbi:MAG: outer membrane lipoprotein carrier protein LolA, partial [Hyphomicrobiales bacterium]